MCSKVGFRKRVFKNLSVRECNAEGMEFLEIRYTIIANLKAMAILFFLRKELFYLLSGRTFVLFHEKQ